MKALLQWRAGSSTCRRLAAAALFCLCSSCAAVLSYGLPEGVVITIVPDILGPGDVAKITVTPAARIASITGTWAEQKIFFYHDAGQGALIALLGVDLEEKTGSRHVPVTFTEQNGRTTTKELSLLLVSKTFPVQELSLPQSQVSLSPQDLQRHEREQALVAHVFKHAIPERLWKKTFTKPLQGKIITPFGVRRLLNNQPRSPHSGLDLRAAAGSPVAAASDGSIAFTGDLFFSGISIFIDHGTGIFSMYFHLSSCTVRQGERVTAGQTIGLVGSTGRSTGPHLHWGIRLHNQRVDPLLFIKAAAD